MSDRQQPHLIWTGAVLVGAIALGGVAYWLWTPQGSGAETGAPDAGGAGGAPGAATDPAVAARTAIAAAIKLGEYSEAGRLLADARNLHGESKALQTLTARLDLRSGAFRATLRPIEFRVESYETDQEFDLLFARVSLGGQLVLATEELLPSFGLGEQGRRANLFTLRTSFDRGASIELVEKGGMFGSDTVIFGPVPLAPLPQIDGGLLEFEDPDAPITRLVVGYRISPFTKGLFPDEVMNEPPTGSTPHELVLAIRAALDTDRLDLARVIHNRLVALERDHLDVEFMDNRIRDREETLNRNQQTVHFVVVEAACDPRAKGKPWSSSGSPPSFRTRIEAAGTVVATSSGGPTIPYLVPGEVLDPPEGNVLTVAARGDAPLRLLIDDTSPTFRARRVGSIDLQLMLSDLPRGTGTLVVEAEPTVLVLPDDEANRLRRVVLRWTVQR